MTYLMQILICAVAAVLAVAAILLAERRKRRKEIEYAARIEAMKEAQRQHILELTHLYFGAGYTGQNNRSCG